MHLGKTHAARKMAKIMRKMGLLPTSKFVEKNADELVAGYVGQSAEKVQQLLQDAEGGVFFVDEVCTASSFSTVVSRFLKLKYFV